MIRPLYQRLRPARAVAARPARTLRAQTLFLCVLAAFSPGIYAMADEAAGERIYQQKCASCHGTSGEGTKDNYPEALIGDRPLSELTQLISETMPEGTPEECVADEAAQVAAYIYDAFYSPLAQFRNKPPTVEFSRLTVRQYRNAIADLAGSFTPGGKWDGERGLQGEYFNSRRPRNDRRIIERRDAVVQFSFGDSSPEPEKIEAEEYSARWQGSVLVPDTGVYDFVVETENGARLWVNDMETPLIDAGVKSGDQTEYRESILLLGGRAYGLRLELIKSKADKTASVALKWKPPQQVTQLIPERHLSPHGQPEVLVIETQFPPDDRSIGYERGTSISKEWVQATTQAAMEVAGKIVPRLGRLAGFRGDAPDREQKIREFCVRFAEGAFRRPLTDEQKQFFIERQFADAPDAETAVRRSVLLVLTSPRFLYREIGVGEFDSYSTASWMAFALWDSLPDKPLLEAASRGELETREQVETQAKRMLNDLRARDKLRAFFQQALHFDRLHDLSKDTTEFAGFDETIVADLRTSLDLFIEDVVWSDSSDFRQLLLADSIYLNDRLASFYGADLPEDAPFQKVAFEPEQRAGVLSHPYLLTGFAYHSTSSPIHRGVFLARTLLGRSLKPPPEAVTPAPPDLHPDLTTRERTELQTSAAACARCHALINPLGFSLEHFDAVGRYRKEEKGRPVDATGSYITRSGDPVTFTGAREVAAFLAGYEESHEAFVEQLFEHAVKQPILAFGPEQPAELRRSFVENGFSIRDLLVQIVTESAVKARGVAGRGQETADARN